MVWLTSVGPRIEKTRFRGRTWRELSAMPVGVLLGAAPRFPSIGMTSRKTVLHLTTSIASNRHQMDKRGVYFFHIPKTAGMSVWRFLEQVFPSDKICPLVAVGSTDHYPESRTREMGHFSRAFPVPSTALFGSKARDVYTIT